MYRVLSTNVFWVVRMKLGGGIVQFETLIVDD